MTKEEKLQDIQERLEEIKADYADIINEYDNDYAPDEVMNLLVEGSSALDDAIDCIYDALEI